MQYTTERGKIGYNFITDAGFYTLRRIMSDPLGNTDGQKDLLVGILTAPVGVDSCLAHQVQAPIHAVEEQPDILDDVGGAALGGRHLLAVQQILYVGLGGGHIHPAPAEYLRRR